MTATAQQRFLAIDILRATTMFFMIFVNDTWTLTGIPDWIEHVNADTDGMGFADIIFPLFLFIVGLSIPYAIDGKKNKGETPTSIFLHIVARTIALLIMGVFLVNQENYSSTAYLDKAWWTCLLILSFFLVWRVYPKDRKILFYYRIIGVFLLIGLAFIYEGADGQRGLFAMGIHWWGILGLIGWGYLTAALTYFISKGKLIPVVFAIVFLLTINIGSHLHIFQELERLQQYFWFAGDGAMGLFCLLGTFASVIYNKLNKKVGLLNLSFTAFAVVLLISGFITRPLWGISKIHATPSWVLICSGIAFILFLIAIELGKMKSIVRFYQNIRPAGSSTLTCYLIPYVFYALMGTAYTALPPVITTGIAGILKSMLFSYAIVQVTGALERKSWKLKV